MGHLMHTHPARLHRPDSQACPGRQASGFSLIELMVVVAVIAVLAAIAYPSYQEQVRKSRRAQAKADLVELVQQAERYRTVNGSFTGFDPTDFTQSPKTGTAFYALKTEVTAANAFTITATPGTTGAQDKDKCGTLGINQANVKSNSKGDYASCW